MKLIRAPNLTRHSITAMPPLWPR